MQSELPLVGNVAPDFEAEAVFDQEFIKVDYFDSCCENWVRTDLCFYLQLVNFEVIFFL